MSPRCLVQPGPPPSLPSYFSVRSSLHAAAVLDLPAPPVLWAPPVPPAPPDQDQDRARVVWPISTATAIVGTITGVTVGGPPVVTFQLADSAGAPLKGLTSADISFAVAQLVPGLNGKASQWNSYLFNTVNSGSVPVRRRELRTARRRYVGDHRGGLPAACWSTMATAPTSTPSWPSITKVPSVPYNAALTHRVAFQIKNYAQANNGGLHLSNLPRVRPPAYSSRRDRRDLDLQQLSHVFERARRLPSRGAVLRDAPQPRNH